MDKSSYLVWFRDNLFKVSPKLIREVFRLNSNNTVHEKIDMVDLKEIYDARRVYLRRGPFQEHFVELDQLPLVITNTPEPLLRKYLNPRAQALYFSCCNIFVMDE